MAFAFNPLTGKLDLVGSGGGSATTDASLLTSGTLADARLSSNVALDNVNNSFSVGQTITAAANTSALTATYSVTGANTTPLLDLSGTWNTTGVATGIKLNVTDTASNASSLLADFQVGGVSVMKVAKNASITLNSTVSTGGFRFGNGVAGLYSQSGGAMVADNNGGALFVRTSGISLRTAATVGWSSSTDPTIAPDTILARDASNTLALRNGGTAASPVPQNLRVYNWYTDSSNSVRSGLRFASNVAELYAEAIGTGVQPQLGINLGTTSATSGSVPLNITQTWNAGSGVAQTALKVNVVDTASAATSLLMDLQSGGTSRFSISKGGLLTTASSVSTGGALVSTADVGTVAYSIQSGASGFERFAVELGSGQTAFARVPANGAYTWTSGYALATRDLFLYRDAANTLALRNGTNAQTSRIYGTYTDASNGRRLDITSTAGGIFTLTATGNGAGASGNLLKLTAPILLPSSSVTLATDGDLAFEATSNTSLTIKYRGSDGTTRSATLMLI